MLLRFTTPDILNTSLVDVGTGECAYDIVTTLSDDSETSPESVHWPSSGSSAQTTREAQTTSKSSETMASASSVFPKQSRDEESEDPLRRKTTITDTTGTVVAEIRWKGRRPSITICDEKVGALADLFGSTVPFL